MIRSGSDVFYSMLADPDLWSAFVGIPCVALVSSVPGALPNRAAILAVMMMVHVHA